MMANDGWARSLRENKLGLGTVCFAPVVWLLPVVVSDKKSKTNVVTVDICLVY